MKGSFIKIWCRFVGSGIQDLGSICNRNLPGPVVYQNLLGNLCQLDFYTKSYKLGLKVSNLSPHFLILIDFLFFSIIFWLQFEGWKHSHPSSAYSICCNTLIGIRFVVCFYPFDSFVDYSTFHSKLWSIFSVNNWFQGLQHFESRDSDFTRATSYFNSVVHKTWAEYPSCPVFDRASPSARRESFFGITEPSIVYPLPSFVNCSMSKTIDGTFASTATPVGNDRECPESTDKQASTVIKTHNEDEARLMSLGYNQVGPWQCNSYTWLKKTRLCQKRLLLQGHHLRSLLLS